jgi:predicted alpha/beta superfamily hydrolase
MGSSLGGLFSFYAGLKGQETFSKIGVFSPSFWYSDEIYNFALNTTKQYDDIKFYFMCGGSESQSMVPDMNKMVNIMKANGFDKTKSVVQPDGNHQEWFWKREYPAAYNYLFQN